MNYIKKIVSATAALAAVSVLGLTMATAQTVTCSNGICTSGDDTLTGTPNDPYLLASLEFFDQLIAIGIAPPPTTGIEICKTLCTLEYSQGIAECDIANHAVLTGSNMDPVLAEQAKQICYTYTRDRLASCLGIGSIAECESY